MLRAHRPEASRFDALADFTPFAVQFRYGGIDPDAAPLDRGDALGQAEALLEAVRWRLTEAEGA